MPEPPTAINPTIPSVRPVKQNNRQSHGTFLSLIMQCVQRTRPNCTALRGEDESGTGTAERDFARAHVTDALWVHRNGTGTNDPASTQVAGQLSERNVAELGTDRRRSPPRPHHRCIRRTSRRCIGGGGGRRPPVRDESGVRGTGSVFHGKRENRRRRTLAAINCYSRVLSTFYDP